MPKTTIVLPTYNEAENIELMVNALFDLGLPDLRILVVDDNSPDGTGKIADLLTAKYAGQMGVIHNRVKDGLGQAYKLGFRRAVDDGAEYIIQMDCDFSHQPEYVPQLIAKAEAGYDVVHGSRYVRGGGVDKSWGPHRKLLSWFANQVYVSTILNLPVRDATGGFRLWRREAMIGLGLDRVVSNGYIFQVELAYVANRLGYRIAEIPIYFPDRARGESKMGTRIILEAALRVWQVRQRHHGLTPQMRRQEWAQPAPALPN
jgi:dolichol-phosphate mannosyltransferase